MKYVIATAMLIIFSAQPTIAAVRTHLPAEKPNPYRQIVNIQKIVAAIVQHGRYGTNPSHSSISFKDGTKTIHFIVYHRRNTAYRFAVSIIEPTGDNNYYHISIVDLISAKGQSLDGFIETVTKDQVRIRNGKVTAVSNLHIEKKAAQRLFEKALIRFTKWSQNGGKRLVIK